MQAMSPVETPRARYGQPRSMLHKSSSTGSLPRSYNRSTSGVRAGGWSRGLVVTVLSGALLLLMAANYFSLRSITSNVKQETYEATLQQRASMRASTMASSAPIVPMKAREALEVADTTTTTPVATEPELATTSALPATTVEATTTVETSKPVAPTLARSVTPKTAATKSASAKTVSTKEAVSTKPKRAVSTKPKKVATSKPATSKPAVAKSVEPEAADDEAVASPPFTGAIEATETGATDDATPQSILSKDELEHQKTIDQLIEHKKLQEDLVVKTQEEIDDLENEMREHATIVAIDEARKVKDLNVRQEGKPRRLKCIGFKATMECTPYGPRVPEADRSCVEEVPQGVSGYCEVEDLDTKERFRVMKKNCDSVKWDSTFKCAEAGDFANFAYNSDKALEVATVPGFKLPHIDENRPETYGILLVIYPKLMPSTYATIRTLRSYNCTLPIELWYRADEMNVHHPVLQNLIAEFGPITAHEITEERAVGFGTKIHAIYNSHFDHLLFLDADNVPVRDPSYLFELAEYKETGALFWPDFWHPDFTIFNIHRHSMLWELVDLNFVDMYEQESGQILIDRRKSAAPLEVLKFYTYHTPNHFDQLKVAHGDKDLFRLSWFKARQSFGMINSPPGVAGLAGDDMFCGMTMVQHDSKGEVLFLHRNAKKLKGRITESEYRGTTTDPDEALAAGEEVDPQIWTHMLRFKPTSHRIDFKIEIYGGDPTFPGYACYGQPSLAAPHFNVFLFDQLPYRGLERQIRQFAIEASDMGRLPGPAPEQPDTAADATPAADDATEPSPLEEEGTDAQLS